MLQDESHQVLYDGTLSSPINGSNLGDAEASLKKQLALTSSKLSQLEAEREHWRLEHQLLQCKHQKEAKVSLEMIGSECMVVSFISLRLHANI